MDEESMRNELRQEFGEVGYPFYWWEERDAVTRCIFVTCRSGFAISIYPNRAQGWLGLSIDP
jgi:hypothetical protein